MSAWLAEGSTRPPVICEPRSCWLLASRSSAFLRCSGGSVEAEGLTAPRSSVGARTSEAVLRDLVAGRQGPLAQGL